MHSYARSLSISYTQTRSTSSTTPSHNSPYVTYLPYSQTHTHNVLSYIRHQAITPTLIIILAALQLTANDVHSRLTRSKGPGARVIRLNARGEQTSSNELDTMQFADPRPVGPKDTFASVLPSPEYNGAIEWEKGVQAAQAV